MSSPAPSLSDSPAKLDFRLLLTPAVIVGALGYFVDIYDLLLFSIVRTPSLKDLGLSGDALASQGLMLLNLQMAGMLLGGICWGIIGDKKGRLWLLFGSIALYSTATLMNGLVHSVPAYAFWRVLAGVGLAGEIGGSMALISELLPREMRGYGTMIIATVGVFGAVVASLVAEVLNWRAAYLVGGVLGLGLLALRVGVAESGMFQRMSAQAGVRRGNFLGLFTDRDQLGRYVSCILIGTPPWYFVGILITLCPEFAKALGVTGTVTAGRGILWAYLGVTLGDFLTGTLSQLWRSRRKVVLLGFIAILAGLAAYFQCRGVSSSVFYGVIFWIGVGTGYWAVFVTIAAEQFGTNLRATVATTVPNFARGALIPISLYFQALKTSIGLLPAGLVTGLTCVALASVALWRLRETYGIDLDYNEPS